MIAHSLAGPNNRNNRVGLVSVASHTHSLNATGSKMYVSTASIELLVLVLQKHAILVFNVELFIAALLCFVLYGPNSTWSNCMSQEQGSTE